MMSESGWVQRDPENSDPQNSDTDKGRRTWSGSGPAFLLAKLPPNSSGPGDDSPVVWGRVRARPSSRPVSAHASVPPVGALGRGARGRAMVVQ